MSSALLIQDPTGYKLVDYAVSRIMDDISHPNRTFRASHLRKYQEPKIFLAGSLQAQWLYKALYPLSEVGGSRS